MESGNTVLRNAAIEYFQKVVTLSEGDDFSLYRQIAMARLKELEGEIDKAKEVK